MSAHGYVKKLVNFEPEQYKSLKLECLKKGCNLQWLLRKILAQWLELRDKGLAGL